MERINVIGLESTHGLRTIELVCGDITLQHSDLLAVSAFRGSYAPTRGTVAGALMENHGYSLREAATAPEFDLRSQFGIWVTPRLEGLPFGRIICIEIKGRDGSGSPEAAMENLFVGLAVLEAKGTAITSLAMPFLGTGNQKIPKERVVVPMVEQTTAALLRSQHLSKVVFTVKEPEQAQIISDELDRQLGYRRTSLPKHELVTALLSELRHVAGHIRLRTSGIQQKIAEEILETVTRPSPPSTEIGLLARRLAEVVADSLLLGKPTIDLYQKIENLGQKGISPWVVNYLHTLRVIGNEVVHIRERRERIPAQLADEDVAVCLFCILRVTRFWQDSLQTS